MSEPEAWLAGPEAWLAGPEAWLTGPEAWLAGPQAWLAGPQAWLDGPEGGTDGRTYGQKISPFYRTSSPIGAAAQKEDRCRAVREYLRDNKEVRKGWLKKGWKRSIKINQKAGDKEGRS